MEMNRKEQSNEIRDAETTYTKATKAEIARDYDLGFRLYVKAAELFLHLSRSATQNDKERIKWRANAGKSLERAEKIKNFVEKSKTPASPKKTEEISPPALTPIGINHFSTQEQFYVLKKGSFINGLNFSLWDEPNSLPSICPFEDPDGQPPLSPEQLKISPVWRRPKRDCSPPGEFQGVTSRMQRILPEDILQHVVTDCSVCASISVCLEHARRFGSKLGESSIYNNQAHSKNCGRYDVRVLFNGSFRRIVVDDKLPYNPADDTLMCMSVRPSSGAESGQTKRDCLWPSLLEKAYMKLMGGYDFPGSNSSIDLHALAGWIPDHIEIKSSSFERERTWRRILQGFSNGQCMVTVGTGTRVGIRWHDVELLPSHSYAVVDVAEDNEERWFSVLDSWVRPGESGLLPSKVLRIPWQDVLDIFDGIYLSWDPNARPNTEKFHCLWKRSDDDEPSHHVRLKFDASDTDDEEIWVLLTRHVMDTRRTTDYIALKVDIEDDVTQVSRRVDLQTISAKGTYTNSTHVLVRSHIPSSQTSGFLSIIGSYEGQAKQIGFTITTYASSTTKISWEEQVTRPLFSQKLEGTLTTKNAGGNCTYPTFMANPQYFLRLLPQKKGIPRKANTSLILQTSKDIPVNISVAWSQGERISELPEKDLAATSGAYTYGLAEVFKDLSVGDYTIIISAFEPHHIGPFNLKVESSHPFELTPIPQEGAGMYDSVIRSAWESNTAVGGPSYKRYSENPIFELDIPSPAEIKIRLQLLQPSTAIALNVTIYPVSSSPLHLRHHQATSGGYDDAIAGVATPQLAFSAGKYWVIPSTYHPGVEVGFKLIVYSSVGGVKIKRRVK